MSSACMQEAEEADILLLYNKPNPNIIRTKEVNVT